MTSFRTALGYVYKKLIHSERNHQNVKKYYIHMCEIQTSFLKNNK